MNATNEPHAESLRTGGADGAAGTEEKITAMLTELGAVAPRPPAFDQLEERDASEEDRSGRLNWISVGAAASIVGLGIGGLIVVGANDAGAPPVSEQPTESIPEVDGTDVPGTADERDGSIPIDLEPSGLGDPLIGAALEADATPMFEIDQPNWVKDYVHGTDSLPLGNTRTNTVMLVAADGPTYDLPIVSLSVFDATGMDVASFGEAVEVGGVAAAAYVSDMDSESGLVGPTVNLTVPLEDDLALTVNSVRLGVDATVRIAESVSIATLDQIELQVPPGFRQLPNEVPATWRSFSYQWGFDDGEPIPEPVVISTPDASETIPQQPTIEVIGSNLGAVGLASRIGLEVRENRVVNGIDVAFAQMTEQSGGGFWVDWIDGDWSYYVIGMNLGSEEQFFELVESLLLTDAETFASSGGVDVVVPGNRQAVADAVLGDLGLTDDQLAQAATVVMPTSRYNHQFELYYGLGCVAASRWLEADAADDDAGQTAALAVVDAAIARPDDDTGLPSRLGLESLADPMRAGVAERVAEFGSNDCPLWSR